MKVLVTGATGFIGSTLCRRLCEAGHTTAAFHRPSSLTAGIAGLPLTELTGDLTEAESVDRAVAAFCPEVIFHLGAQMTPAPTVDRIMQINVLGTRAVLQAALKYRVNRVILMSSAGTLGLPELHPDHDRQPPLLRESRVRESGNGLRPFARSKYLAEMEAQSAAVMGLDVVILNPFMVIGPGDWYRRKSSFLLRLKQNPPEVMVRGGLNIISVEDAVSALINGCRYGKTGERYLLCGNNLSFRELCESCAKAGGFESPRLLLENENFAKLMAKFGAGSKIQLECLDDSLFNYTNRFFYYDPSKSRIGLHLSPPETLDLTIEKTYRWLEENA